MRNAQILIVEDDVSTVFGYTQLLEQVGYNFQTAENIAKASQLLRQAVFDVVLLDLNLPDGMSLPLIKTIKEASKTTGIIVISGNGNVSAAVEAMKNGADNYLVKPVDLNDLEIQLQRVLEVNRLKRQQLALNTVKHKNKMEWGTSSVMQALIKKAGLAAGANTPILIQGETGTGKGELARWVHENSNQKSNVFVDLNCSTFKGELLKSELFGHVRGAFTSAHKERMGLIEAADGGTLFLDEIGDMDAEVQTQLLKVIEEKTFRRVGENKTRRSDFRLICATHKDIAAMVKTGAFREDLYFRISVFPLKLPALRERNDDIPRLAEQLLQNMNYTQGLDDSICSLLKNCQWQGNVRELKNNLERALIYSAGGTLLPEHFFDLVTSPNLEPDTPERGFITLEEMEMTYIKKALRYFGGDKNKVSEALGLSLSSLYRKLPKADTESI